MDARTLEVDFGDKASGDKDVVTKVRAAYKTDNRVTVYFQDEEAAQEFFDYLEARL